jgi:hypothetical protein
MRYHLTFKNQKTIFFYKGAGAEPERIFKYDKEL